MKRTPRSPPGGGDGMIADDGGGTMPVARSPKLLRSNSSKKIPAASSLERALLSFRSWEPARPGKLALPIAGSTTSKELEMMVAAAAPSPSPRLELDEAATRVQKAFKGHRTRRTLADCAIVVEELWWKLYESASLDRRSVSFFAAAGGRRETAASRWVRAGKRIARLGKGLCNDDKAQQLALRHWLEAIDPRHRYGHNLHLYYDIWFQSSSTEPFFYWLDIGAGREIHHPTCPRTKLNSQLIMYLGMNERTAYEVVVVDGRLTYIKSGLLVNTTDDSKWIFVLSTTRSLYVGQKRKGKFQHSSFLAGGATSAAGRLVAKEGVLKAIWPYSGHYLPTEENFNEFIAFLQENKVDLTNVKRCSVDDDEYPSSKQPTSGEASQEAVATEVVHAAEEVGEEAIPECCEAPELDMGSSSSSSRAAVKWTSGAGARIGCVREYPAELQNRALEQVNLSPTSKMMSSGPLLPIPSPRPSPRFRLSPRVQYMGVAASPSVRPPPKQQCLNGVIRPPTVRLTLPSSKSRGS